METQEIKEIIEKTLISQYYGVYNTIRNEQPHSALVGFAPTPDLTKIIILTPKNTRKYVNTQLNHKVTLFISTTTNDPTDLDKAITISIIGTAEVSDKIPVDLIKDYRRIFLQKNTYMEPLAGKIPEIIVITVEKYEVTRSFQKSVIQTSTDMTTLRIRQIPGIALTTTISRGKVVKVLSLTQVQPEHENSILALEKLPESDKLPSINIKGLITCQDIIPDQIKEYITKKNISCIQIDTEAFNGIRNEDDLTINGSLGLVIFHEIKN